ncbi:MAG: lysophospholipid acyltransferase family protein [Bacteroidota bacterium]|nr:lysophospholipid acyltransferase family protein [Bacteroidota bacterium]MDP4217587.1 lysophospholipid acyltransferase family protein [Bacteroidota bacterium]MDP4244754.1 lysophospholipid acyltransferase family protein [Bacteroidota bacterium]MDP4253757.1 lysophospholipid acyltransferase family protein [Bacteroidota bacterium]MDP4258206.1 lysophospholipid acyltransferase family protein [Bacteroidota bacterium]
MYYVVYGGLYLVSLLPLWLLYPLSDVLALLLYYVIRYRRRVVFSNLSIAFPEKSEAERRRIARKFYRNFVDNFIETIKLLSASRSFIMRHFVVDNPEVLEEFYAQGRRCQLHLGHNFNWELANAAIPFYTRYTFIVVYMPIENKLLDRLFLRLRRRTGSVLLPATSMQRAMMPYRNEQYLLALVGDQAPPHADNAYWLNFFGRPTPFIRGPERGARAADIPDVFVRFYRTRRGYYRIHFTVLSDHSAGMPEGRITLLYARHMEDAIRQNPDLWLWSHKRWKHEWKEEFSRLRVN